MVVLETKWALDMLIGAPLLGVVLTALLVMAVLGWWSAIRDGGTNKYGWTAQRMAATWSTVALAFLLPLALLAYYPYKAEYHQWRTVDGTVSEVGNRLLGTGSGMEQRYVLVIDGQPYGVDDTRASLVKVGDEVHLRCIRDWQYASTPGWVCRWNQ